VTHHDVHAYDSSGKHRCADRCFRELHLRPHILRRRQRQPVLCQHLLYQSHRQHRHLATNDGGAVSDAVETLSRSASKGGTDIRTGIADLTLAFGSSPSSAAGIAIVFTDGIADTPLTEAEELRAAGVTVAAVGIGNTNTAVLEDIASERADGSEIVFTGSNFEEIEDLFSGVIRSIGAPLASCSMRTAAVLNSVGRHPELLHQ